MTIIKPTVLALCLSTIPAFAVANATHEISHAAKEPNIGQAGIATKTTRTVEITLKDNYFDTETITVQAGETIRFVLKNEGGLLHEFNIGTSHMHEGHQTEMLKMMQHGMLTVTGMNHDMAGMDHGSMPEMEGMAHNDPNSILVNPGETRELTWTFSGDAELEFACNMPGHYQAGMVGEFKHES